VNVVGERIIIFGDSLSHPGSDSGPTIVDLAKRVTASSAPGEIVGQQLLNGGAQAVRIDARVGRSAQSFFSNEDSAGLLASDRTFRPSKVIVMLGTNDIDQGLTAAALAQTTNAMTKIRDAYRAMGAEVFAIGPPSYTNDHYTQGAPTLLQVMQNVFGVDHTIDARNLTRDAEHTSDGVHFTVAGAANAGPQLANAVLTTATPTPIAGMSPNTKLAIGTLGLVAVIGISALALRAAKQLALRDRLLNPRVSP
jgi:lysophospholipase L1-like esterase